MADKIGDLDQIINQKRKQVYELHSLDYVTKAPKADTMIDQILYEIEYEAAGLKDNGEIIRTSTQTIVTTNKGAIHFVNRFRKLDRRLQSFSLYRNHIRKLLRNIYVRRLKINTVNVNELMKYEDTEFISTLYRTFLNREPDNEGLISNLQLLRNTSVKKIELIHSFHSCKEAKLLGNRVKLKGQKLTLCKNRIRRGILRIPVIGYLFSIIWWILVLPKRMQLLYSQISQSNYRAADIEQSIYKLYLYKDEQKVQLEKRYTQIEQDVKMCVQDCKKVGELEHQYKKINTICKRIQPLEEKCNNTYSMALSLQQVYEHFIELEDEKKRVIEKQQSFLDEFYLKYKKELMSDPRNEVKDRLRTYLPIINQWADKKDRSKLEMVDLGCGFGELVELLQENGYSAYGVDSNVAEIYDQLANQDIKIKLLKDDALQFLNSKKDNSLDFISAFHMVEHLAFKDVINIIQECYRVLKPGGMILLETPNPQNIIVSTYLFYMDPTHNKPFPPELLEFMVQQCGFTIGERVLNYPLEMFPYEYKENDPLSDFMFRLNMEQAYGIYGVKK